MLKLPPKYNTLKQAESLLWLQYIPTSFGYNPEVILQTQNVVFLTYSGFKIIKYSNGNSHSTITFFEVVM
jgi:hypothetical protein